MAWPKGLKHTTAAKRKMRSKVRKGILSPYFRHGHARPRQSPTYKSWATMWTRCTNPNVPEYCYYGGRGIAVCDRWNDFVNFLADMGERPVGMTLDRIDNNKGYFPGNVRWATKSQQMQNRRPYPANRKRRAVA